MKFYENGLRFTCIGCGYCCREEPGFVFLTQNDLDIGAKVLQISQRDFIDLYCRIVPVGSFSMISLKEKSNNDCIFLHENRCKIYNGRPFQCRSYPFWASVLESRESWIEEMKNCPGIGNGILHSAEVIDEWLDKREKDTPILV